MTKHPAPASQEPTFDPPLSTPRQTGRTWRRILRVLLITLAMLLIARLIYGKVTADRLHEARQSVRQSGQPLWASELPHLAVPPQQDAWPLYETLLASAAEQGIGLSARSAAAIRPATTPSADAIERDEQDRLLMEKLWADLSLLSDPAIADPLRQRLDHLAPLLSQLAAAAARPAVGWPLNEQTLWMAQTDFAPIHRLLQFMLLRAILEADAGDHSAALDTFHHAVFIANHFSTMPTLHGRVMEAYICHLLTIAAQHALTDLDLAANPRAAESLRQALRAAPAHGHLQRALIFSRAINHTILDRMLRGRLSPQGTHEVPWSTRLMIWVWQPFMEKTETHNLALYAEILPLLDSPYHEYAQRLDELAASAPDDATLRNELIFSLKISAAGLAFRRLNETALAARQFEQDHGRLPQSLDELTDRYLPAVPADPMTGQPLSYLPDEHLLYSVGIDRADNHGRCDRNDSVGFDGHDICFHLRKPQPATEADNAATQPAQSTE